MQTSFEEIRSIKDTLTMITNALTPNADNNQSLNDILSTLIANIDPDITIWPLEKLNKLKEQLPIISKNYYQNTKELFATAEPVKIDTHIRCALLLTYELQAILDKKRHLLLYQGYTFTEVSQSQLESNQEPATPKTIDYYITRTGEAIQVKFRNKNGQIVRKKLSGALNHWMTYNIIKHPEYLYQVQLLLSYHGDLAPLSNQYPQQYIAHLELLIICLCMQQNFLIHLAKDASKFTGSSAYAIDLMNHLKKTIISLEYLFKKYKSAQYYRITLDEQTQLTTGSEMRYWSFQVDATILLVPQIKDDHGCKQNVVIYTTKEPSTVFSQSIEMIETEAISEPFLAIQTLANDIATPFLEVMTRLSYDSSSQNALRKEVEIQLLETHAQEKQSFSHETLSYFEDNLPIRNQEEKKALFHRAIKYQQYSIIELYLTKQAVTLSIIEMNLALETNELSIIHLVLTHWIKQHQDKDPSDLKENHSTLVTWQDKKTKNTLFHEITSLDFPEKSMIAFANDILFIHTNITELLSKNNEGFSPRAHAARKQYPGLAKIYQNHLIMKIQQAFSQLDVNAIHQYAQLGGNFSVMFANNTCLDDIILLHLKETQDHEKINKVLIILEIMLQNNHDTQNLKQILRAMLDKQRFYFYVPLDRKIDNCRMALKTLSQPFSLSWEKILDTYRSLDNRSMKTAHHSLYLTFLVGIAAGCLEKSDLLMVIIGVVLATITTAAMSHVEDDDSLTSSYGFSCP